MSRTTQENGNLSGQNWIPDVPDLRSEGSNIYALFDFRSRTKKQSEPHGMVRSRMPARKKLRKLIHVKKSGAPLLCRDSIKAWLQYHLKYHNYIIQSCTGLETS